MGELVIFRPRVSAELEGSASALAGSLISMLKTALELSVDQNLTFAARTAELSRVEEIIAYMTTIDQAVRQVEEFSDNYLAGPSDVDDRIRHIVVHTEFWPVIVRFSARGAVCWIRDFRFHGNPELQTTAMALKIEGQVHYS